MRFADRLQEVMVQAADVPAIEFMDRHYSWAVIGNFAGELNKLLQESGVDKRAPAAVIIRNRPSGAASLVAAFSENRCPVLISSIQPASSLCRDVRSLVPPILIADREDWSSQLVDAARESGTVGIEVWEDDAQIHAKLVPELSELGSGPHYEPPEGAGVVVPTSGTTGTPKRIPIEAYRLDKHVPPREKRRPIRETRGIILANPLATITGLNILLPCASKPLTIVLMERLDVNRWADLVSKHRPRRAGLPPAAMQMMLDAQIPKEKLSSLDCWVTGSAPLDPVMAREFEDRFDLPVLYSYGATEFAGALAVLTLEDRLKVGRSKWGTAGRALPGVEFRVLDPDADSVLPAGATGVLEVRSKDIPGNPANEWVRTTDLAYIDEDGYLFIVGRVDDVIIRGGFKVPLNELESTLREHAAVSQSAAIGLPDQRLGQVPVAAVVLNAESESKPDEDAIVDWLRERIAPYKVPVSIKIVEELPLNASLKVNRAKLRELFESARS